MNINATAFAHHPELQDKISNPMDSFFRDFDAVKVFSSMPELEWVLEELHSDAYRDESRQKILTKLADNEVWVFAYGSLMWDPALIFAEVRRAQIPDYERRFILKDVWGARGTRKNPGLMAALDKGKGCDGLIYRISAEHVEAETKILWNREMVGPGYLPVVVSALVGGVDVDVITFIADHSANAMQPEISRKEQIEFIATGAGIMGTSHEYLSNIVSQFSTLGIVDEDCSSLLSEVEKYMNK